ncbi:ABC transporter permease [Candidatus Peregrinibacteria bacterium]|nr:ABC transporter permease [Candidatus Peregrinibacteria bacterium]
MHLKYSLKTAIVGLKTNRSRSILTILGIVIGITAIILISSLGAGAQALILGQLQGMGTKTIAVLPGRQPKSLMDATQIFSDSLVNKDLDALKRKTNVPYLAKIMPIVFGADTAFNGNESYRLTIFGASDLVTKIFDIYPTEGEFFTDEDVRSRADVVVIGSKVKKELFGSASALGQKIRIKGKNFRVVGILPEKGQSTMNFDEAAIIPHTTAQQYIFGIKYFHRLIIEANAEENVSSTIRDIEITLRNSHGITDPDKDDFHVETAADIISRLGVITSVLTLFLVAVAAISLIVGGIGIMNIMLVSVTERTREIGLRKSIGATNGNILFQFLLEAVLLTGIGGAIGICLGAVFSFLASLGLSRVVSMDWSFTFPLSAALIGLFVSGLIGLVFGLYPAKQAAKKSPIEALRYE